MRKYVIDRFEGNIAVCEDEEGSISKIPKYKLPLECNEGDYLLQDDHGMYSSETPDVRTAENRIREKTNRLLEKEDTDKTELFKLILTQLKALLEGETYVIPNLANTSALLNQHLNDINWVGFYLIQKGELLLGPFQGRPACIHIPIGKGVCGTAVSEGITQLVDDVHTFPGHIACDSASRSELVVPIRVGNHIIGVLDIDSPTPGRFDAQDLEGLEKVAELLANSCDWAL